MNIFEYFMQFLRNNPASRYEHGGLQFWKAFHENNMF